MSSHPPEVSEADTLVSDRCEGLVNRLAGALVGSVKQLVYLLIKDVDVRRHIDLPLLNDRHALHDALVLTYEHIDLILHVVDEIRQVLHGGLDIDDVLASIVAGLGSPAGGRNHWRDNSGRVCAVDEDRAITAVVVVHVIEELVS